MCRLAQKRRLANCGDHVEGFLYVDVTLKVSTERLENWTLCGLALSTLPNISAFLKV